MMPSEEIMEWFKNEMFKKLKENSHKRGYQKMRLGDLTKRLHQEAHELSRAIQKGKSVDEIVREAADVANFALMIADVVFQRDQDNPWYKRM